MVEEQVRVCYLLNIMKIELEVLGLRVISSIQGGGSFQTYAMDSNLLVWSDQSD